LPHLDPTIPVAVNLAPSLSRSPSSSAQRNPFLSNQYRFPQDYLFNQSAPRWNRAGDCLFFLTVSFQNTQIPHISFFFPIARFPKLLRQTPLSSVTQEVHHHRPAFSPLPNNRTSCLPFHSAPRSTSINTGSLAPCPERRCYNPQGPEYRKWNRIHSFSVRTFPFRYPRRAGRYSLMQGTWDSSASTILAKPASFNLPLIKRRNLSPPFPSRRFPIPIAPQIGRGPI